MTKQELLEKLVTREQFAELQAQIVTKPEFETFKLESENRLLQLDRKFSIYFIVILFAILFINQNALSFIARMLGMVP